MRKILGDWPGKNLILFLAALTIARLYFASAIELTEDEAYYRLWGLFPSYAYFDHAPMVGWWIAIGQSLFGDNAFGLRVLSPLSAFIGSVLIWRIALISFDRAVADLAVILFNAMPLIGIGGVMMTPDVPSVFFWGMALWTLIEWTRSRHDKWWLAFGIAAGLGLLSKYTNAFLGVGVLLWLIGSGRWRDAIRTPYFYLAGILVVVLFSPVIYWNYSNDWASFSKQFGRLKPDSLTMRYLGEWVGGQILLMSPVIFITAIMSFKQNGFVRNRPTEAVRLIILSLFPLLIYFLINSLSSRINANWTAPIFSSIAILSAAIISQMKPRKDLLSRGAVRIAAPLGYIMSTIIIVEALVAFLPVDRRNPISQIRGNDQLAESIQSYQRATGATAIVTSRYQTTAMLAWKLKNQSAVFQLTERIRYRNLPIPDLTLDSRPILYVGRNSDAKSFFDRYMSCFKKAEFIDEINRSERGVELARYQIWIIEGLNSAIMRRGQPEDCLGGP